MKSFRITTSSHGFKVDGICDSRATEAIHEFLRSLLQYGLIKVGRHFVRKPVKTFAASNASRNYYRFHINDLKAFLSHMAEYGFKENNYTIINTPLYEPRYVELPLKPKWKARENQITAIDYVADETNGPACKLIPAQPGFGKGLISMMGISAVGVFAIYLLRPMYMDKWREELEDTYDIDPSEIITIQGNGELKKMLDQQKKKEFFGKVVVISNKTYQAWLSKYEKLGHKKFLKLYPCTPENFFEFMKAGFRLIDEGHQDFHLNCKIDYYTNVPNSITLTATLITKDPFLRKRMDVHYPKDRQCKVEQINKYIDSSAYFYQFKHPEKIRTTEFGSPNYSHLAFEASILQKPQIRDNYFEMIKLLVDVDFFKIKEEGEKFVVFCSKIDFSRELCAYLRKVYPSVDIRTYVEDDPYENLIDPVGRVTTYGSAGTAQDIPMLRTNINTIAMDSLAGNIQILGRTRVMKSGNTPRYVYLVAENIDKHITYHNGRKTMLEERARSFRVRWHDKPI
ncbi:MAG: hypothetical protein M0R77_00960 [Gammaproteobacteria bacterium]|nr:hypothetical protein [Acholeplasmataceae bacterium]MCK9529125.1 hypothetical protein [Gammaproteobacteria bacterium]